MSEYLIFRRGLVLFQQPWINDREQDNTLVAAYSNDQTGPSLGNKCSTEAKSLLIPKEMHYLEGKFT